jgi:hypothetical protein
VSPGHSSRSKKQPDPAGHQAEAMQVSVDLGLTRSLSRGKSDAENDGRERR